jgi:hypothetical protein
MVLEYYSKNKQKITMETIIFQAANPATTPAVKLNHTPGPWELEKQYSPNQDEYRTVKSKVHFWEIGRVFNENWNTMPKAGEVAKANATLIASAPKLLDATINAYIAVLEIQDNMWRINNQALYCQLLSAIADATGYSCEYVNNYYEDLRLEMKIYKVDRAEAEKRIASRPNQ